MAIILIIVTVTGGLYYLDRKNGATLNGGEQYLILKEDLSFEEGSALLQKKSLIRSERVFRYYAKFYKLDNSFKAGNFIIKARTSMRDLLLQLQSGKSDFLIVTIPEGYTLYKIGETLEKNNLIKKEEILKTTLGELKSGDLIEEKDEVVYDLEGYLFPDTYYIPVTADKQKILDLMYGNFLRVFSDEHRTKAAELGLSVNEVITIASLIEKEAANDEERAKIAGVIYNRLKIGMKLQIDAAVIYANTFGEKSLNPITKAHLKKDSKYNTYVYKELPPGPIASPGKPSIIAALYPESHEYLYYVKGPNGHVFSKTYDEHLRNIDKYLK